MDINTILNIVFSIVFLLFLPGFVVSLLFFDIGRIDAIERFALSTGLSLAILPLAVFYLNLAGMKINQSSVAFTNVGIIVLSALGYVIKKLVMKRTKRS